MPRVLPSTRDAGVKTAAVNLFANNVFFPPPSALLPPCPRSRRQVLIDELGRGTSNREGMAMAWAVAERLLSSAAFTLFVTHYAQIPGLADLYPNVKNM